MRVLAAIFASVAVHAALIAVLSFFVEYSPSPDEGPILELASVEVSFSERDETDAEEVKTPDEIPSTAPEPPKTEESVVQNFRHETTLPLPPVGDVAIPEPPESRAPMPRPTPVETRPAPKQSRIDAPPRLVKSIRPDYPNASRRRGDHGKVVLDIAVSETGAVVDAKVAKSSGHSELDAAAVKAAMAAILTPAKSDGKPVSSRARISIDFVLK